MTNKLFLPDESPEKTNKPLLQDEYSPLLNYYFKVQSKNKHRYYTLIYIYRLLVVALAIFNKKTTIFNVKR